MGQVLHGSATVTEAVRRAMQNSQKSLRALAQRYGINQKTAAKGKMRGSVADLPTGPKDTKSTVLSRTGRSSSPSGTTPCYHSMIALHPAADDPAPDALVVAPLPAAARHFEAARCGWGQAGQEEVQNLPDRLLSYRYCRGADRRGQALSTLPLIARANSPSSRSSGRLAGRRLLPSSWP